MRSIELWRMIALTGHGRDSEIASTRALGFEGHLTKPVELGALTKLMKAPKT